MITKEDAAKHRTFYHIRLRNADGTALRCRANGRLKTWKRDEKRWELPVKYGLKQCFRLDQDNCPNWTIFDITETCRPSFKLLSHEEQVLQQVARDNKANCLIYSDWLEEKGFSEAADHWRTIAKEVFR